MTDYQKGQTVTVSHTDSYQVASGSWSKKNVTPGTQGVVTQVYRNVVRVRITFPDGKYVIAFPRECIDAPNGETYEAVPKPPVRKLGTPPEGMISPDDPRIAWLWEDAGKMATRLGLCYDYDRLTSQLGIPGRERDYDVSLKVNGLDIRVTLKARSQKEADALAAEKLGVTA